MSAGLALVGQEIEFLGSPAERIEEDSYGAPKENKSWLISSISDLEISSASSAGLFTLPEVLLGLKFEDECEERSEGDCVEESRMTEGKEEVESASLKVGSGASKR